MSKKTRKTYTDEQKTAILKDVKEFGIAAAAKKNNVSVPTLYTWGAGKKEGKRKAVNGSGLLSRLAALEARVQKLEKVLW